MFSGAHYEMSLNTSRKQISVWRTAYPMLIYAAFSGAQTPVATGMLEVNAQVVPACRILEVTALKFPRYNPSGANTGQGAVQFRCARGAHFTLALDEGEHATRQGDRRLQWINPKRTAFSQATQPTLAYTLYRDKAHLQVWGQGEAAMQGDANGEITTAVIHGKIQKAAAGALEAGALEAGEYRDIVRILLSFS
jgi:spore coat protein U-like protein